MYKLSATISKGMFLAISLLFLTGGTSWAGWHQLTPQSERGIRLISGAIYYNGRYLGNMTYNGGNLGECKVFMQKVVHDVSANAGLPDGTVNLPTNQTYPNDFKWNYDPNVWSYGALDPYYWQPGMIIQMRTRYKDGTYGPHTAMVASNNGGNITFVESNYLAHYTVDIRSSISRADFLNQTEGGNHFTVYEIH